MRGRKRRRWNCWIGRGSIGLDKAGLELALKDSIIEVDYSPSTRVLRDTRAARASCTILACSYRREDTFMLRRTTPNGSRRRIHALHQMLVPQLTSGITATSRLQRQWRIRKSGQTTRKAVYRWTILLVAIPSS